MELKNNKEKINTKNMTVGSPLKLIFAFSIPLLIGNVFQQLYNMVDSIVVGNYVGKIALAAVGTGFPIIFLMSSMFIGIGLGATILISQYYGAKDLDNVRKTSQTIYTAMIIGTIPLTIIGILLSGPILRLINVPEDTLPMSQLYMNIVYLGLIGNLGFNINAGILQGIGDSKSSLLFLSIACVINIILDLLFVIGFGWGVAGVAIATIVAQISSWIFGIIYMHKKYEFLKFNIFKFGFDKDLFKQIFRLGIPSGIQQCIFSLGVMSLQSLVNSGGSDFMAGFNAANKIDTFAFMPVQSFSNAITTFVGQNIGAGKMDRVHKGMVSTLLISLLFCGVIILIVLPLGPLILRMFNPDPAVISAGMAYLSRVLPFFLILAVSFTLNSVMRGAGETIIPMISSVISLWLARIPLAYFMADKFGLDNMFYSYAVGWAIGLIITGLYYMSGKWKLRSMAYVSNIPNQIEE